MADRENMSVMAYNGLPVGRLRDIVELLAAQMLPLVESVYAPDKLGRGTCVLVSHIVQDVLRRFGFDAGLLSCVVLAHNPIAAQCHRESEGLTHEEAEKLANEYQKRGGRHILAIGDPSDPVGEGGWAGHLVNVIDGFLLDFTLGQFSRPQKQLDIGPVAVPLMHSAPWPELTRVTALSRHDGAMVTWYANTGNLRYQAGRAAQPDTRAPTVDVLEQFIRQKLSAAA